MPRVTPSTHHERYIFLRAAWLEFPKLYALLPLEAQWQVHEFYQPTQELTRDELTAHIKTLSETKPALVHQVGKHFRLLETVFTVISEQLDITKEDGYRMLGTAIQQVNPSGVSTATSTGEQHTLSAVARPELNIRLLAKALLGVAEQERKEEQKSQD